MNLNNDQLEYYKTNGYVRLKGFLDIDYLKRDSFGGKGMFYPTTYTYWIFIEQIEYRKRF